MLYVNLYVFKSCLSLKALKNYLYGNQRVEYYLCVLLYYILFIYRAHLDSIIWQHWTQTGVCSKWLYPNQNPVTYIIFFSINILHIDCYCVKGLWSCFLIELVFFKFIIILRLLMCKYAPFWQEVSVNSLILGWPLRPVGLFFFSQSTMCLLIWTVFSGERCSPWASC